MQRKVLFLSSDVESSGLASSDSLRRVKWRSLALQQRKGPKCSHVELEPDFELPSEPPPSLKDEAGPSAAADQANTSQNEEPLDGNHQSIINKSVEIIKETNINGDIFEDNY